MQAPRRSSTRRPASAGRSLKLIAIWAIITAAVCGFAAAAYHSMTRPPDPFVLCEHGGPITASSLVIIDTTDALTEMQQRRVRYTVERERDTLPPGGKLSIVAINAKTPSEPFEIVSACNPGSVKDINILFQTASKADKAWKERFSAPVEEAIAKASHGAASDTSPIIATIAAVLQRPDFDARVETRRLIVASDLLEYQKGVYSQLSGGDFWTAYQASPLPRMMPLDLHGATVAIEYFARPAFATVQGEKHRGFWRKLFQTAGARDVAFVGLREAERPVLTPDNAVEGLAAATPPHPPAAPAVRSVPKAPLNRKGHRS